MPKVAPEYSVEYKEEARKRIMEVGIQVFAENGYHQTTMDDVAKELNVSKGTLYLYFNSKEELLNKKVAAVVNLEPRKMGTAMSECMILAAVVGDDEKVVVLQPEKDIDNGAQIH